MHIEYRLKYTRGTIRCQNRISEARELTAYQCCDHEVIINRKVKSPQFSRSQSQACSHECNNSKNGDCNEWITRSPYGEIVSHGADVGATNIASKEGLAKDTIIP